MKTSAKDLLKVAGAAALIVTLASVVFIGVNGIAFAAATQPAALPMTDDVKSAYSIQDVAADYKTPNLTVIIAENLDGNGKPYYTPAANTMSPEEAAQIGARYIWDMFGESMDGKTVEMSYTAWPSHSRTHWHGTIEALYGFSIDAVTGEWISIQPRLDIPEPTDPGEGKTYTLSPVQFEALQYEAPANVDEYAEAARAFAQKHFNHSTVTDVEFVRISLNQGGRAAALEASKAYHEAYHEDKNKPFTFTLYEKGRSITFNVTDDTGRTAFVLMDMDSKQVILLDTSDSDFIPGYSYEVEGGIG
jgi:hypothetical protein